MGDGTLETSVIGSSSILRSASIELSCRFDWTGQMVREVAIYSLEIDHDVAAGYSPSSAKIYKSKEYAESVAHILNRLFRFSEGQIEVAYVVAQYAARSIAHPFWRPSVKARGRGLSP